MSYIGDLICWQLRDLNFGVRPGLISLKTKAGSRGAGGGVMRRLSLDSSTPDNMAFEAVIRAAMPAAEDNRASRWQAITVCLWRILSTQ